MNTFIVIVFTICVADAVAQKQPLTSDAHKHWGGVFNEAFSDDGKYVIYQEKTSAGELKTFEVSIDGMSRREIQAAQSNAISVPQQSMTSQDMLPAGFSVVGEQNLWFNNDSTFILLDVVRKADAIVASKKSSLTIWNYNDDSLPTARGMYAGYNNQKPVNAAWDVKNKKLVLLSRSSDDLSVLPPQKSKQLFLLTASVSGKYHAQREQYFIDPHYTIHLTSLIDGKRQTLSTNSCYQVRHFSPDGEYVLGYNLDRRQYFTYRIATKKVHYIGAGLNAPLYDVNNDQPEYPSPYGLAGWSDDGKSVYVYDEYDMWKLSLDDSAAPVNITKGYGRQHDIVLRLLNVTQNTAGVQAETQPPLLPNDTTVYLAAFNKRTKQN
jgi:hypothetical protein